MRRSRSRPTSTPPRSRSPRAGGADALHPGYGFLSESPELAEACRAAGLVFVGPPADALATLARKDAARELAQRAGMPVVPGGADADGSGYPLLVKAPRRRRRARHARRRRRQPISRRPSRRRRREAEAAFGDRGVLLRALLDGCAPRRGADPARRARRGLHLGERDCSLQRRHQKVIEEAPAPGVGRELRGELGAAALRLAEAVGYVGAGTAEFLLAPDGSWYFLEMNARIQVEHPVTELVTSIDIVRRQLEIAAGLPLELQQGDVLLRGHAIEARIYAEDAEPASCRPPAACWPCAGRAGRACASTPASTGAMSSAPATTGCWRSSACTARRARGRSRACARRWTTSSCSA